LSYVVDYATGFAAQLVSYLQLIKGMYDYIILEPPSHISGLDIFKIRLQCGLQNLKVKVELQKISLRLWEYDKGDGGNEIVKNTHSAKKK
jgi:hypothetical protein